MVRALADRLGWLLGYQGIPFTSRSSFRFELQHFLLFACGASLLNPNLLGLIAKKELSASDTIVSAIVAAIAAGNLLAVFWGAWSRRRSKKVMLLLPIVALALVTASIWLGPMVTWSAPLFCMQAILAYVCLSAVNTMRSSIWRVNYPRHDRAKITSRFTVWIMLVATIVTFIAQSYLDGVVRIGPRSSPWWSGDLSWLPGAGQSYAYRNIYPLAALLLLGSVALYSRVRIRGERNGPVWAATPTPGFANGSLMATTATLLERSVAPLRSTLQVFREDRDFRDYMVWQFISGSVTMMVQVPLVLILAERFNVDYSQGGYALVIVPFLATLVTTPYWGRWFDRTNILRFRNKQMTVWAASRLFLAAGVGYLSMPLVMAGVALGGIGMGGGRLAWMLGHMQFAKRNDDALYMGIHVSLTGLRGCVMPFVGTWLFRDVLGWHIIWMTGVVHAISVLAFGRMANRWERQHEQVNPPAANVSS